MFPDPQDSEPLPPQPSVRAFVACAVPFDLRLPKGSSYSRHVPTPRAAVPEATIHEDGELRIVEKEVRVPEGMGGPEFPATHSRAYEGRAESALGGAVV